MKIPTTQEDSYAYEQRLIEIRKSLRKKKIKTDINVIELIKNMVADMRQAEYLCSLPMIKVAIEQQSLAEELANKIATLEDEVCELRMQHKSAEYYI